jgi:plastocyanin
MTHFLKGVKQAMKKLIAVFALLSLVALLVAACGGGSGSTSTDVHLGATNFVQNSVTISKGGSINLINDTATTHIISNGKWNGSTPQPGAESGAPTVSNMTFNTSGQTMSIGPFTTAGTFHYYCSVHPGMNLTVTVQ